MKTYFKTFILLFTLLSFSSNLHSQVVGSQFDLSDYQLVSGPTAVSGISDDLSGVTYNPLTNSLFMITNKNHAIYETTLRGQITRTINLTNANDTEDIVHIGGTTFALAEERLGEIVYVNITASTNAINLATASRAELPGTWGANDGLEGVSYDPATDRIFTVKEKSNINLYNFTMASGNVNPATCNLGTSISPAIADVAAVHHLGLTAGVSTPDISDHMLVLSQESNVLIEVDDNCTEYSRLSGMLGNQIEGVTMDNKGNIYVVGEPNELYIYSNCRVRDSLALVELYHSTNGDNWSHDGSWDFSQPISTWSGVRLNQNGCVSLISLPQKNLTGTLPAELGNLKDLYFIDIYNNNVTGNIPPEMGNLPSLQYLHLNHNQLSGPIPPGLGNPRFLRDIRLHNNQLTGTIPSELGNLNWLRTLSLGYNQLSGAIPTSLGNLPRLSYLNASYNQLTGEIPASLGSTPNLRTLIVSNNQLSGCYDNNLLNLCNKISNYFNRNRWISDGNNFDTPWETFCSNGYCVQNRVEDEDNNYVLQNYPNPFSTSTTIEYNIPEDANKPTLDIFDVSGKLMYSQSINQTGTGTIEIQAGRLTPGVYHYRLTMSDAISATKRMVIVK